MNEPLRRVMTFNDLKLNFAVVGPRGGIHYWTMTTVDKGWGRTGGIEMHSPVAMYSGQVTHGRCWLLGGDCWHDGSSLQATEYWNPLFDRCNVSMDFEPLWRSLEGEYRQRFADKDES